MACEARLRGAKTVRASSMFGFSLTTVIFEDNVDKSAARQRILERFNIPDGTLPDGVVAKPGPDATGLGWVYQYCLDVDQTKSPNGRGYDRGELRSLQDWFIRYQLNSVPGGTGLGSKNITTTIEGRNRYPAQMRLERGEREDLSRLKDVLVTAPPSSRASCRSCGATAPARK